MAWFVDLSVAPDVDAALERAGRLSREDPSYCLLGTIVDMSRKWGEIPDANAVM